MGNNNSQGPMWPPRQQPQGQPKAPWPTGLIQQGPPRTPEPPKEPWPTGLIQQGPLRNPGPPQPQPPTQMPSFSGGQSWGQPQPQPQPRLTRPLTGQLSHPGPGPAIPPTFPGGPVSMAQFPGMPPQAMPGGPNSNMPSFAQMPIPPQARPGTGNLMPPMSPMPPQNFRPGTGPLMPPQNGRPATSPLRPFESLSPAYPTTPPPFPRQPARRRPRRLSTWMLVSLAISALLIVASTVLLIMQQTGTGKGGNHTHQGATPIATPTQTEHQRYQQLATKYVDKMSLEDMIAQLIFVNDNADETTQSDLDYMIGTQHIGGVLVYWNRILDKAQVQGDIQKWTGEAKTPLFVATEDEGGYVDRLSKIYPRTLSAQQIAATGDPTVAATQGNTIAQQLKELTFNTTFTPVVDVAALKDGYLDWDERSFGSTGDEVVKYAGPYLSSIQKAGLIGSVKHFPGLGRVPRANDPHGTLPTVDVTKEELYQNDLVPFKHFVQSKDPLEQPGFVMTTYVVVPSIDPNYPAQYSSIFVTDILRKEFGYNGVIITDALVMRGSQINGKTLTMAEGAVAALKAGNDMLLGMTNSDQIQEMITGIKYAIQNGDLTQDRVKQSAIRVITLKLERHVLSEDQVK